MADQSDSLIREIEDEMREEQLHKLWKRYGSAAITAAVLVVAIVAGYQGWNYYITSARMSEGEQFHKAQLEAASGNVEGALVTMRNVGTDGVSGYSVLARFQEATLLASRGESAVAAEIFFALADDHASDPAINGLAVVLGALQALNSTATDWAALSLRLGDISQDASPWRHSAREVMALAAIKQGNVSRAQELLKALSADRTAPAGVRKRANILLARLDG